MEPYPGRRTAVSATSPLDVERVQVARPRHADIEGGVAGADTRARVGVGSTGGDVLVSAELEET